MVADVTCIMSIIRPVTDHDSLLTLPLSPPFPSSLPPPPFPLLSLSLPSISHGRLQVSLSLSWSSPPASAAVPLLPSAPQAAPRYSDTVAVSVSSLSYWSSVSMCAGSPWERTLWSRFTVPRPFVATWSCSWCYSTSIWSCWWYSAVWWWRGSVKTGWRNPQGRKGRWENQEHLKIKNT